MRIRCLGLVAATVSLGLLAAGCVSPHSSIPRQAPTLDGVGLDGSAIDISDHEGTVVLVTAWASWCTRCAALVPDIEALQQQFGIADLEVIGLNVYDSPEYARAYAQHHQLDFPSLLDQDGSTAVNWGLRGVPETFLIDRDGQLVSHHFGEFPPEWLDEVLVPAVSGTSEVEPTAFASPGEVRR